MAHYKLGDNGKIVINDAAIQVVRGTVPQAQEVAVGPRDIEAAVEQLQNSEQAVQHGNVIADRRSKP